MKLTADGVDRLTDGCSVDLPAGTGTGTSIVFAVVPVPTAVVHMRLLAPCFGASPEAF